MKKQYIQPKTTVLYMNPSVIIAASINGTSGVEGLSKGDETSGNLDVDARSNMWDFDWE